MSVQSFQTILPDLLVELSTEQQELLAGGRNGWGGSMGPWGGGRPGGRPGGAWSGSPWGGGRGPWGGRRCW